MTLSIEHDYSGLNSWECMVSDSCRFDLNVKRDFNVSTIFIGNISEIRLMNNRTKNKVEIG